MQCCPSCVRLAHLPRLPLPMPQELYGAERTSTITAALSRLFTAYHQRFGFSCGMSDVMLVPPAEAARTELLRTADVRCLDAAAKFAGLLGPLDLVEKGMSIVSCPLDAFQSHLVTQCAAY